MGARTVFYFATIREFNAPNTAQGMIFFASIQGKNAPKTHGSALAASLVTRLLVVIIMPNKHPVITKRGKYAYSIFKLKVTVQRLKVKGEK